MPPPSGPDIAVKCYYGDAKGVEDAIAAGADVLEIIRKRARELPNPVYGIALHQACYYAHVDCVRALLTTGCYEQLDWRRASYGETPLMILCMRAADGVCFINRHQIADTLPCVELLLEAGAALEPKTTEEYTNTSYSAEVRRGRVLNNRDDRRRGSRVSPSGLTALDFAHLSGRSDIVRALEEAASLRYSVQTHRRFPRPARYAAAHSLRLGYQIGSGALVPVWAGRVLPFLISRTSRGPAPARLPDKATVTVPIAKTDNSEGSDEAQVGRLAAALDEGLVLAADPAPRAEVD